MIKISFVLLVGFNPGLVTVLKLLMATFHHMTADRTIKFIREQCPGGIMSKMRVPIQDMIQ